MAADPVAVRSLTPADCRTIASAFTALGWHKPVAQYERYLAEQEAGTRWVFVATVGGAFAGYVTLAVDVGYPPFRDAGIPGIQDLNVLPRFRRRGVATALLDAAEAVARQRSAVVGLGVGLSAEYGPAQRLYVLRGYVPDGRGAAQANRTLAHGERIIVDDDLVLFLTRRLGP